MTSPHLKAVIFDIGGVVCRSPLIAIAAYEREHGIPNNYINCAITTRGSHGAWQKFERGEIPLFPFYEQFGRELSDTVVNNPAYAKYCKRHGLACPKLPETLSIDGRELFGRMMRESGEFDARVVEAIRRIRAAGRWRVIALTNNFSKSDADIIGDAPPPEGRDPRFSVSSERAFLGWHEGATPPRLRALFDDFCDSSTLGMRKPEPGIYLLACERNGIKPSEAVFLDDLGMNLKAAQALGMETIHGSRAPCLPACLTSMPPPLTARPLSCLFSCPRGAHWRIARGAQEARSQAGHRPDYWQRRRRRRRRRARASRAGDDAFQAVTTAYSIVIAIGAWRFLGVREGAALGLGLEVWEVWSFGWGG
ncbi:HAD-like domain-containing protein [Earliella scabrosa]|nr:HAD-like domain-containing protein [Earliella scabrosa]